MMIDDIVRSLNENGDALIQGVSQFDVNDIPVRTGAPYCHALKGVITVNAELAEVLIALPHHFPVDKPLIFLVNRNQFGFIPHVEPDGFVCYVRDDSLLLDQDNPYGIVQAALRRAVDTLKLGASGQNRHDFLSEFEAYWMRQKPHFHVDCILRTDDTVKEITVLEDVDKGHPLFLFDKQTHDVVSYARNLFHYDVFSLRSHKGIYIPLRETKYVMPPDYDAFWTFRHLKAVIFSNLTKANKRTLERFLKRVVLKRGSKAYIVLSIPQADGNYVLVGVELSNFATRPELGNVKRFVHPLLAVKGTFQITPFSLKRHHPEFLVRRTSGYGDLYKRRVAVVGVGAVGSRIAVELVRSGISSITLIDKDELDIDNVFRHELGANFIYHYDSDNRQLKRQSKVSGLVEEITSKFPLVSIKPIYKDILDMLEVDASQFQSFDLVVVAIGDPTVELYINRILGKLENPPVVIYTWLEPLGIGGHAIATMNRGLPGCFECLYTNDDESDAELKNKASFAAPNQYFGKMLSGCESTFTPYGSLDALQTAILAARLAVSVLTERESDNPILSWKGESVTFLSEGFKTSDRYELSTEGLFVRRYGYKAMTCPVCGGGEL